MSIFGWLRGGSTPAPPAKKKRRARLPKGHVRYRKTLYKHVAESNARGRATLERMGYKRVE